jgi:hypothetical protein
MHKRKLFSYVVDHDTGHAPNPTDGYCTLVKCKYRRKRRNIIELAEEGDWIVGTGGADNKNSAGHGKIVFAMQVDEKISFVEYCLDPRFTGRSDSLLDDCNQYSWALISHHYYYFGRNAIAIPEEFLSYPLEKVGPSHRSRFEQEFIEKFVKWVESSYAPGLHGEPCAKVA